MAGASQLPRGIATPRRGNSTPRRPLIRQMVFLARRCAELKALPSCEVLLPNFGDPHNLSSPPSERLIIIQEKPERPSLRDGEGSARVGDEIPIWVARGDPCYNRSVINPSNSNAITSNFSRTLFDSTMEGSKRSVAGNQAEQTGEKRQPRQADETGRSFLYLD